jgi:hypothetical protein
MGISLLKYISEEGEVDPVFYDNIRYILGNKIYYYGDHFKYAPEKSVNRHSDNIAKKILRDLFARYQYRRNIQHGSGKNVLSNAYFNFNVELKATGFNVLSPAWSFTRNTQALLGDVNFYRETENVKKLILEKPFNYIFSDAFQQKYKAYRDALSVMIDKQNINALIVPNDISFFENLAINTFKEAGKPSFIFLHGLPGRYNVIDENRTDYLIVWGEQIKRNYIKHGFSPDKIFVGGHPLYKNITSAEIRSGLENVLVLAKVGVGSPHSTGMTLYDRSNQIVYLLQVQKALQKVGVKKARLRFHPSANPEWHYQFLDRNFFILDEEPLPASLKRASLVIGPTSTVFLEALYAGVNYLIFEPSDQGVTILNEHLVAPFDGLEPGVPFSATIAQLEKQLKDNVRTDRNVLHEYIKTPFNVSFLKDLI